MLNCGCEEEVNKTVVEDKKFLQWLRNRLVEVYGENPNVDYVLKLERIIKNYPEGKDS